MKNAKAIFFLLFLSIVSLTSGAVCPTVSSVDRFQVNGSEVLDKHTGLVWSRCSAGLELVGDVCVGVASKMTHEQALQYSSARIGWRLPNVRELVSLTDKGCISPTIDAATFPNTAGDGYWSSTPYLADSNGSWVVSFEHGGVDFANSRSYGFFVRLIRVRD